MFCIPKTICPTAATPPPQYSMYPKSVYAKSVRKLGTIFFLKESQTTAHTGDGSATKVTPGKLKPKSFNLTAVHIQVLLLQQPM